MKPDYRVERARESRLHGFGLVLGLILALLAHAVIFWGPEVGYRPALEQARLRRVLVARPYRPLPPPSLPEVEPTPAAGAGSGSDAVSSAPVAKESPQPAPGPAPATGSEVAGGELFQRGRIEADPQGGDLPLPGIQREERQAAPSELSPDEWAALMVELEKRGMTLEQARSAAQAAAGAGAGARSGVGLAGAGGGEDGDEGFLDPRIRINVVAYPPQDLSGEYPSIRYPDLRLQRRQLQAGICRVYYRVWLDDAGEIVRRQLKTPVSDEEREHYALFVEAVTRAVDGWMFAPERGEVHVDVLFEIE